MGNFLQREKVKVFLYRGKWNGFDKEGSEKLSTGRQVGSC